MNKSISFLSMIFLFSVLLSACQKVTLEAVEGQEEEGLSTLSFNISRIEQYDFPTVSYAKTRSASITDICSRINLLLYQNGKRVNIVSQTKEDADFGKLSVSVKEGEYQVAILAGNWEGKNPTSTEIGNIKFGNGSDKDYKKGLTDVFLWQKKITVNGDIAEDVKMNRAVAMVKFVSTDSVPTNVGSIRFSFSGGSSAINASTGLGVGNTSQNEFFKIDGSMRNKPGEFDVYTFPKGDDNKLSFTVTTYDNSADGNIIAEKKFVDIPVARNQITKYTGRLFSGGTVSGSNNASFNLTTEDEWNVVDWKGAE